MQRIQYLNGLRGLAALIVAMSHYFLAFYPAYYTGNFADAHWGNGSFEVWYYHSVCGVLTNGNFAVYIFFLLSGFVLSRKYFLKNDLEIVVEAAAKRYLRLFIPVAATIFIAFVFIKWHFFHNTDVAVISKSSGWLATFWQFNPDLKFALYDSFIGVFFYGSSAFSNTLWTMGVELYGSMLVFSVLALTHGMRNRWLWFVMLVALFAIFNNYFYMSFIVGIILSLNFERFLGWSKGKMSIPICIALFALAAFCGGYPSRDNIAGTIYARLPFLPVVYVYDFYHMVGGICLLLAIFISPLTQRILSFKPFAFLGNISFSLYLIHPVIIGSFSCWLFLKLQCLGYNHAHLVVLPVTLFVLFGCSYLMTITVDNFSISFPAKLYKLLFKMD